MNLDDWLNAGTSELADLAALADGTPGALDELLQRGLEWLSRIAPYDLAVVFELKGGELLARAAHGPLADDRAKQHRIELDRFPSIRLAIEERRSRVFTEKDHAQGEGDPFDGVMDFPHGHSCMVVPLVTGTEVFGVMSLDRRECVSYPKPVVDLVEVFGRLLALNVRAVRQTENIARAGSVEHERLAALDRRLEEISEGPFVFASSKSAAVRELARQAVLVAATNSTVLVLGETGTGKERLARFIHRVSPRAAKPFVPVNCSALPAALLESELFGHEKGAFTGAVRPRAGLFRAADGGSLFLDEVGEIPFELQAKLLRALQEGEIQPLGTDRTVQVNVRLIAATHVDLKQAVAAGRFREDLYYRLCVYPLLLPPLRERKEDLPELCVSLLQDLANKVGKPGLRISKSALEALSALAFAGNIRELSNVLEGAAIRCLGPAIERSHLALDGRAPQLPAGESSSSSTRALELVSLAENERRYISQVLAVTQGRIYGSGGAAEILGMPPTTLQSKMKKLGIKRLAHA